MFTNGYLFSELYFYNYASQQYNYKFLAKIVSFLVRVNKLFKCYLHIYTVVHIKLIAFKKIY